MKLRDKMRYIITQKCNICHDVRATGTLVKNTRFTRFICKMCDMMLYHETAEEQKVNWLRSGSVSRGR